jgi:hypothetical protein
MQTLADAGADKLLDSESTQIREAADELIFSLDLVDGCDAADALEDVARLCRRLVESERWEQTAAMRLANDVAGCGPGEPPKLLAA